jgi:hypothetical protein
MYTKFVGLIVLLTLFILPSHGQFSKGMRMAGGTLASGFFNSGKYEYTFPAPTNGYTANANSFGITLSPNLGWFVSDHTVIGARLSVGYNYEKNIDATNNVTFRKKINKKMLTGLGGFARNYFSTTGSFIPFGEVRLDAGFGSSSTEGFTYSTTYKDSYKGKSSGDFYGDAGLSFGATKMISTHAGLDIFAGYTFFYSKTTFKTTTQRDIDVDGDIDETAVDNPTTKLTNHGFTFGIGFQVFLGKRQ